MPIFNVDKEIGEQVSTVVKCSINERCEDNESVKDKTGVSSFKNIPDYKHFKISKEACEIPKRQHPYFTISSQNAENAIVISKI